LVREVVAAALSEPRLGAVGAAARLCHGLRAAAGARAAGPPERGPPEREPPERELRGLQSTVGVATIVRKCI